MKMQVIIEFDVKECDTDGVHEGALERLETMTTDRICDLVRLGFMYLFSSPGGDEILDINNMMFDGEGHLLIITDPEVKRIAVVENFDVAVPAGAGGVQ